MIKNNLHSISYCVKSKIPKELYNRYISGIKSESRSSIIIYLR